MSKLSRQAKELVDTWRNLAEVYNREGKKMEMVVKSSSSKKPDITGIMRVRWQADAFRIAADQLEDAIKSAGDE